MRALVVIILMFTLFSVSCSKEEPVVEPTPIVFPEQYERFIGAYKVYDTIGNFMYDMDIVHHATKTYPNGQRVDTLIIQNFADTFDVKYEFRKSIDKDLLSIGIFDSIVDKNNKSWALSDQADDPNTLVRENKLINDTLIMYFRQTNIKYYIPEAQPYFYCKCKHVAVKQ